MKYTYSLFHKTLPRSSLQMHLMSVRFMKWAICKQYVQCETVQCNIRYKVCWLIENLAVLQGETELSFRLTPSLTRSYTKPQTKQLREEVIFVKEDISLKDNSVSYCTVKTHSFKIFSSGMLLFILLFFVTICIYIIDDVANAL